MESRLESRIIPVFYGKDCLPYKDVKRKVNYPIIGQSFVGASKTTIIHFYFRKMGNTNTTWVAVSQLPDGKSGSKILRVGFDTDNLEPYAILELESFYTQCKGDVYISLQGYKGDVDYVYDEETGIYTISGTPVIETAGNIKINIAYAPDFVGSGETQNVTFEELMAMMGTKIGETSNDYITVVENINTEDLSQFQNDHIFFATNNYSFYKKDINEALGYVMLSSFDPQFSEYYTKDQIDAMIAAYTYEEAIEILEGGN